MALPFLTRIFHRVPSLFDARMPAAKRPQDQKHFIKKLNGLIRQAKVVQPPQVHLLSLADLRPALPTRWPGSRPHTAAMLAKAVIIANLDPPRLFTEIDPDTYLLAFPSLGLEQARHRLYKIAGDVSWALSSGQFVSPPALAASLPFSSVCRWWRLDLTAIERGLSQARALVPVHSAAAPQSRPAPMAKGARPIARAECRSWPCVHDNGTSPPLRPRLAAPALAPDSQLRVVWRPTWVSQARALSAHCARIVRSDGGGRPWLEGSAAYPSGSKASLMTIERHVIGAVVSILQNGAVTTDLILQICWESLQRQTRRLVTGLIADLPNDILGHRVKMEIFGMPEQETGPNLLEMVGFLRRIGCETLLRQSPERADCAMAARSGASMIGIDLSCLHPDQNFSDEELMVNLLRLRDKARRHNLGFYLWGVRRRPLLTFAINNGFDMVNGPALAGDLPCPTGKGI
ncbi:MAG TPA: hypothetical protein HPP80_03965 [Rhodospirillaceae bacterium]|nr:hypothetical protein [Rhodospirillaceae bacterium]